MKVPHPWEYRPPLAPVYLGPPSVAGLGCEAARPYGVTPRSRSRSARKWCVAPIYGRDPVPQGTDI
jgi:hypothetical protein